MRTKIFSFFLVLIFSAPAFAQQPRIDSITVDEDKGELILHGSFQNSDSAIVLVDSVSQSVTLASDTLIRATIPVKGKGSAGWVIVSVSGDESNARLLTYIHFQIYFSLNHRYSDGGYEIAFEADTMNIRSDFSIFNKNKSFSFPFSKISKYHDVAYGNDGINGYKYTGPTYDSIGILTNSLIWNWGVGQFTYDIDLPSGRGEAHFILDNNFEVPIGNSDYFCGNIGGGTCLEWSSISPTNFPPSSASIHEALSMTKIIQASLSSDPIATNAEVIVTLQNAMNVRMEIMDILGHLFFSEEKMLSAGENRLPVNSSALPSGIYICRLQAGGEVVSLRFVKE